ncbi:MAG: fibronectin type III domain-containing protein [Oscillospiraceae bacterium]|nr:fibronectin type III domain-containing protein [Oscillospiraceae bacterium]
MKKFISVLLIVVTAVLMMPVPAAYAAELTVGSNGAAVIPKGSNIGAGTFKSNTSLKSATIPDGCAVGKEAFANCVNLTSVTFEGSAAYIDDEAFLNCTSLEKITFKKPNASISYIGKKAFANCFSLETVTLPSKTGEIREFAFGNCISLNTVTVPKSASAIGKYAFGYMLNEKTGDYFAADGATEAYISYYRMFNGDLLEWYSPNTGCAVSMNVVKNSAAEKYAKENGIAYVHFKSVEAPEVKASAGEDSVVLTWNKIDGADAYRVSILKNGKFTEYKTTPSKKCTVEGLESGKTYTFKVAVLNKTKAGKYTELIASEELKVSTKTVKAEVKKQWSAPEAPSVTAEAASDSVVLKWKKVDNADAYRVMIYNSEKNKYETYKTAYGKSCTITGLSSGTQYKFKIVSLYTVKNKFAEGGSTEEIVISTANIVTTK